MLWLLAGLALAAPVLGPDGTSAGEADPAALFRESPLDLGGQRLVSDPAALGRVARAAACWVESHPEPAPTLLPVGRADVVRTLLFVAETAEAHPERLADPAWLDANFRHLAWSPDTKAAEARGLRLPADQIRLTRYLVYAVAGSPVRTDTFDAALWSTPDDDALRARFTRAQVLDGAFAAGGPAEGHAEPLVWLRRADVHRALMQGTVQVDLPDGPRLYNVDQHNGIPYDPAIRDPERQDRLWYFREVDGIYGFGPSGDRVRVEAGVTVAGDVANLGVGPLVALRWGGEARLAVLADTGGAFQPNLFQLDWLAGTFPSHEAYLEATRGVPNTVHAGFLVVRPEISVTTTCAP